VRKRVLKIKFDEVLVYYLLTTRSSFITSHNLEDIMYALKNRLRNYEEEYNIRLVFSTEYIQEFLIENSYVIEYVNGSFFVRTSNKELPIYMGDRYKINPVFAQILNEVIIE